MIKTKAHRNFGVLCCVSAYTLYGSTVLYTLTNLIII